jgi:hypothetical protein
VSLRGQVCARVIATPSHNNVSGQCRDTKEGYNTNGGYTSANVVKDLPLINVRS